MTIGAALLACVLSLGACAAQVQVGQQDMAVASSDGRFQVTWEIAQTRKGSPLIAGYIKNTRGNGAANIRVRVDTLDAQGQVIATATGLVPGYVGGFGSTFFEVPLEKTGIEYRVSIIGWDSAGNGQ
jgi:hypothetical protein